VNGVKRFDVVITETSNASIHIILRTRHTHTHIASTQLVSTKSDTVKYNQTRCQASERGSDSSRGFENKSPPVRSEDDDPVGLRKVVPRT